MSGKVFWCKSCLNMSTRPRIRFDERGWCNACQWMDHISKLPVGEIYLNSMDRDGTGHGYFLELLDLIPPELQTPIILAGGAGNYHHLAAGLKDSRVDAVATAHLFNFVGDGLDKSRTALHKEGFNLATWDASKAKLLKDSV